MSLIVGTVLAGLTPPHQNEAAYKAEDATRETASTNPNRPPLGSARRPWTTMSWPIGNMTAGAAILTATSWPWTDGKHQHPIPTLEPSSKPSSKAR